MTRYHRASTAKGFALIEVLVGILIFAVGVLGIVGLQVSMTRAQTSGKFRSDAAYLANELIGSMWGDIPNIGKYASAQCASHGPCADWTAKVGTVLPGGAIDVTSNAASGEVHIKITWTVPSEGNHVYETWTNVQ